jgi:hypothetical protein
VALVLQRQRHFVHVRLRSSGNLWNVRVGCGQYYVHDSYLHSATSSGQIEICVATAFAWNKLQSPTHRALRHEKLQG